jgi:hypothetical protein
VGKIHEFIELMAYFFDFLANFFRFGAVVSDALSILGFDNTLLT